MKCGRKSLRERYKRQDNVLIMTVLIPGHSPCKTWSLNIKTYHELYDISWQMMIFLLNDNSRTVREKNDKLS